MRVCITEITAKLILNLTLHGWVMKKSFSFSIDYSGLKWCFSSFYLTEKHQGFFFFFLKKIYGPFLWMGFNCLKATATFIDLGRMKGWVDLGATQWPQTTRPLLHLAPDHFYEKRILLKNFAKSHLKRFLITLYRIPHAHRKGSSLHL